MLPSINHSTFRTGFTFPEELMPSYTVQGKIVNVNLAEWTVDVVSQFDQLRLFNIAVGSPYLHWSRGEGYTAFPEVGAKCLVTIPSDSSPPFISSFIMPMETLPDGGMTFGGSRQVPKPGDQWIRGRDGNFLVLHRGGVLQVGCSETCQSIYIPLSNLLTHFTENFAHHAGGGSILWGLQEGNVENPKAEHIETYRVRANDSFGDLRICKGYVQDPIGEPVDGAQTLLSAEGIGTGSGNHIVYEISYSEGGFDTGNGRLANKTATNRATFRFLLDKEGGGLVRMGASLVLAIKKSLRINVEEEFSLTVEKSIDIAAERKVTIRGTSVDILSDGGIIRLSPAGGGAPVARAQDVVQVVIPPGLAVVGGSGTLPPTVLTGTILSGNPKVLA